MMQSLVSKIIRLPKENLFGMGVVVVIFTGILTVGFAGITHAQFVEVGKYSEYDPPGFFSGIWHGLIAPYTLIIRWFIDIKMYAIPNSGWFYDLGFLLGLVGSIPIGWLAAIISIAIFVFS